jgi:hypothetical protein
MSSHSQSHDDKVKMTFECTEEERVYIKMLAARARMNLSEFVLSFLKSAFPQSKLNKKTVSAHKEALAGRGTACESIEDFWKQMGVNLSARS